MRATRTSGFLAAFCAALAGTVGIGSHAVASPSTEFRREVQPILKEYCYDCHGDGASKGKIAFDALPSDAVLLNHDLWLKVLKNVRSGLMPPEKKPRLAAADQQKLERWIKYSAFGIDPANPDPGRVTVRRLNRVEYRNTIRDLIGIDFNAEVEFPPDDTGYGFDTIGDVLTLSPMLLEKYLTAAKSIVAEAVPTVSRAIPENTVPGGRFRRTQSKPGSDDGRPVLLSYYEPGAVSSAVTVDHAGSYRMTLQLGIHGGFEYDPGRCRVVFKVNDREVLKKEFGWHDNKTFHFDFDQQWQAGEQRMSFTLEPLVPLEKKLFPMDMRIVEVDVHGPLEKEQWTRPRNYERFFVSEPPAKAADRRAYARERLGTFASRAFRRPVDARTRDRLTALAESIYTQPGKTVEAGIAHAMVAVLASPRFLFRLEEPAGGSRSAFAANIDDYALASRLSYFLLHRVPKRIGGSGGTEPSTLGGAQGWYGAGPLALRTAEGLPSPPWSAGL